MEYNDNVFYIKSGCGKYLFHIDKSTGKHVHTEKIMQSYEYARNKNSDAAFKEMLEKKIHIKNKGLKKKDFFVAFLNKKVRTIISEITIEEATHFFKLLTKITMKSKGKLVNKEGKPLSVKGIGEVMGLGERRTMTLLKRLKELKMILVKKDPKDKRRTIYFINKEFHIMGEKIKDAFTQVYQEKIEQLVQNKTIGNALGTFYKMIPYFHYQTYYFVWNPDTDIRIDLTKNLFENLDLEETQKKLQHIVLNEFAEFISIEPETFTRHLNLLEDIKVIKRDVQGQSVLITIHPDFVFRKDYQNKDDKYYGSVIRYQFSQHQRTRSNKGRKPKKSE
ncbi:hypothetical protein [Metabacillus halosaccharovorans]|uniref:hypothetical protein n=1 Tax=Metabacillus halosaccharovorans TaxID=930124 RepID=UPI00203F6FB7|nr:hypothetical protein [Metabacillus halosaccharovorans]MCM3444736.1 hypothetical protein [Metabacillus halosaccharovorans]